MFWQWLSRHFFCFGAGYNCDHDCFFGTDVLIADKPIAYPLAKPHPAWSSCFDTVLLPLQACLPSDSFCLYAARDDGLPAEYKFSINREVFNCKRVCFSSRQSDSRSSGENLAYCSFRVADELPFSVSFQPVVRIQSKVLWSKTVVEKHRRQFSPA